MTDQEKSRDTGDSVIYKTPPKMAFTMGILVGLAFMSMAAFVLTYSLLRSEQSKTAKANTNTGQVAGAGTNTAVNSNTNTPVVANITLSSDDHVRGDKNAKVTLVEYSDFQCSYCGAVEPTLEKLLTDYKGKVKLVFRHFPLTSIHPNAQKAAEASECANDQGKFWELHDKMFDNQTALTVDNLKQYAKDLGLNTSKFNSCLDSGKYTQKVTDSESQGAQYGIEGTPATFVNGTLVSGAVSYNSFKQIIDAALAAN